MKDVAHGLKVCILAIVALLWLAVPNGAAESGDDQANYVRIGIGVNAPAGDLDKADYDEGLFASIQYGRYLIPKYLVFEAGIHNFFSDRDTLYSTTAYGDRYRREDSLAVFSLMGTLKGELPLGPLVLFAGGGVGGYWALLHSDIDVYPYYGEYDSDDSDFAFGLHVVGGGYYSINRRLFVGIEGLYRWTGQVDIEDHVFDIPVRYEGNLNGYMVSAMVGFRF